LNVELQGAIRLDGYILPNNSNRTNLFSQTSTLQILGEKCVVAFKPLSEEKKRVLSLLKSISSRHPSLLSIEAKIDVY